MHTADEVDPFAPISQAESRPDCCMPNCKLAAGKVEGVEGYTKCVKCDQPLCYPHWQENYLAAHNCSLLNSKKTAILNLWHNGIHDVGEIVRQVKVRPSYVAQVLQTAGLIVEDSRVTDLFYSRYFRNVLSLSTMEAAEESVKKIDRLSNYFERLGDRRGQHQAMILALTGMNRARWNGKLDESMLFRNWLNAH